MAVLGLSKLDAVRQMMEGIGETKPVPALDTGGSSTAAQAERVLDRESIRVQSRGFRENTIRCKKYTPTGGPPAKIQVGTDVLHIESAGPNAHRTFDLKGDYVFDIEKGTDEFDATDTANGIFLDVIVKRDFVDCSPKLKDLIVQEATLVFQRRENGNPNADAMLEQERTKAELLAQRPVVRENNKPINPSPMVLQSRPSDKQQ
jgi:hypothetical protein